MKKVLIKVGRLMFVGSLLSASLWVSAGDFVLRVTQTGVDAEKASVSDECLALGTGCDVILGGEGPEEPPVGDSAPPAPDPNPGDWLTYLQSYGNLGGASSLDDWGTSWVEINDGGLTNAQMPVGSFGVTSIGDLGIMSAPGLTNVDFLRGVTTAGGVYFSNTGVASTLGFYEMTYLNDLFLFNTQVTNLDGLVNLTSVGGRIILSQTFTLTDISGLRNLGSSGVALQMNDPSQYTVKAPLGSAFCNGLDAGTVTATLENNSNLPLGSSELCE